MMRILFAKLHIVDFRSRNPKFVVDYYVPARILALFGAIFPDGGAHLKGALRDVRHVYRQRRQN
ncbi:MAG: hypothetical protein Q8O19_05470, partial [Rectinemataceae bacterium]|nr:hypothetical protein [Rectinemataceae bacterium]